MFEAWVLPVKLLFGWARHDGRYVACRSSADAFFDGPGGWGIFVRDTVGGTTKQANVTLKRGIVNKVLWEWHQQIATGDFRSRDCTIRVQDPSGGDDLIEFTLVDAFPVKWIGPELAAAGNTIAIETLELAHQGLKRSK